MSRAAIRSSGCAFTPFLATVFRLSVFLRVAREAKSSLYSTCVLSSPILLCPIPLKTALSRAKEPVASMEAMRTSIGMLFLILLIVSGLSDRPFSSTNESLCNASTKPATTELR